MIVPINKKRVLLIATNGLGKSGVPVVFMNIVKLFHEEYDFDIIITRKDLYFKEEFLKYGGKIFEFYEQEPQNKIKRIIYKLFFKNKTIKKNLTNIFKTYTYSIVHSFKDSEGGIYLKYAKKHGIEIRLNHFSRQYETPKKFFNRIYEKQLIKKIYKYSTNLIVISKTVGESLPFHPKYNIVYNTYNEDYYSIRKYNKQGFSMCQIGTILPLKNQLFSLKFLKLIKQTINNPKLYFIGLPFDTIYLSQLKNFIEKNDLQNNVEFISYDTNQFSILDKCFCSLIPSTKEGLSLVAIESQSIGMRCFASTGVPEEVSCGNIIFLPQEETIWAKKIIEYYQSKEQKRLKVNMSKFSNENFKLSLKRFY